MILTAVVPTANDYLWIALAAIGGGYFGVSLRKDLEGQPRKGMAALARGVIVSCVFTGVATHYARDFTSYPPQLLFPVVAFTIAAIGDFWMGFALKQLARKVNP